MKIIVIFMICTYFLSGIGNISIDILKNIDEANSHYYDGIQLDDYVDFENSKIKIKNEDGSVSICMWNSNTNRDIHIKYLGKDKIVGFFYEDISFNNIYELFFIFEEEDRYRFESYSLLYSEDIGYIQNKYLDKYINEELLAVMEEFDIEVIKKEVGKLNLIDFIPIHFDWDTYYFDSEKVGYYQEVNGRLSEVEDIYVADTYIRYFGNNIYGVYKRDGYYNFYFYEAVEGSFDSDNLEFYRDGRYSQVLEDGIAKGQHKDNYQEGYWYYFSEYWGIQEGYYSEGMRVGKWRDHLYEGEYVNGEKEGWWTHLQGKNIKQFYDYGRLVLEEEENQNRKIIKKYEGDKVIIEVIGLDGELISREVSYR